MIENEIVAYIPETSRGFPPTAPLCEIVNAIPYKLKTGVQWDHLPVRALFGRKVLSRRSVYHHNRKWCRAGFWKDCWIKLLDRYRKEPDLSSVDLDGSHTPAKRGGENMEYQGRKKLKTTNSLYLGCKGIPLAMSGPVAGNHNDLYDIEVQFEVVTGVLEEADICFNRRNGNGDRDEYLDKDLYAQRYAVERTNAWMDSYRSLLNKFDATTESRKGFNYLAFMVIALKKFKKEKKKKV